MYTDIQTHELTSSALHSAFDEDGFLINPEIWTEAFAQRIANEDHLGDLTKLHWEVIAFVRDRHFRLGALPPMRTICRKLKVSNQNAHKLFPSCRQLWRVAGLPNPGEEAKTYML